MTGENYVIRIFKGVSPSWSEEEGRKDAAVRNVEEDNYSAARALSPCIDTQQEVFSSALSDQKPRKCWLIVVRCMSDELIIIVNSPDPKKCC